jgi:hypothetical protein
VARLCLTTKAVPDNLSLYFSTAESLREERILPGIGIAFEGGMAAYWPSFLHFFYN